MGAYEVATDWNWIASVDAVVGFTISPTSVALHYENALKFSV
jgi:hypothetical protein